MKLDRVLTCYRIGDPDGVHPLYDPAGSRLFPGRWNTPSTPMIYASEHYSTALLEKLVHAGGVLPPNQHFVTITIPNGIAYEMVTEHTLPGWHAADGGVSKDHGARWVTERRTAILIVPSVVARLDRNILINPDHPDAVGIAHGLPEPIWWDSRLFAR